MGNIKFTKNIKVYLLILITSISILITLTYSDINSFSKALLSGQLNQYFSIPKSLNIDNLKGIFPTDNINTDNILINNFEELIEEEILITPSVTNTIIPSTIKPTNKPNNTITNTPTITPSNILIRDYSKPWLVSTNCPISTMNCVPCDYTDNLCRIETGETRGFRGWACQNNNPGNIRPINNYNDTNDFRNRLIKAMGGTPSCGIRTGTGGSYMVFSDYQTGFNSLKAYILAINAGMHTSYLETLPDQTTTMCGECSLRFFLNKWAANPHINYINTVSNMLGVNPDTTTLKSIIDAGRINEIANAIKTVEGFITQ